MKVSDILEGTLIKKSNQLDRGCDERENSSITAKRIANAAKDKAKKNNPEETETPSGWRADPHQGGHVQSFINR